MSESIESDRDGNSLQLMDVIGMDDTMLEDLYDRDSALRLRRLVNQCLTRRESEIIRLRYGLGGTVPLTQREIASTFGISRSYVSRIEKRALQKLEAALKACGAKQIGETLKINVLEHEIPEDPAEVWLGSWQKLL